MYNPTLWVKNSHKARKNITKNYNKNLFRGGFELGPPGWKVSVSPTILQGKLIWHYFLQFGEGHCFATYLVLTNYTYNIKTTWHEHKITRFYDDHENEEGKFNFASTVQ